MTSTNEKQNLKRSWEDDDADASFQDSLESLGVQLRQGPYATLRSIQNLTPQELRIAQEIALARLRDTLYIEFDISLQNLQLANVTYDQNTLFGNLAVGNVQNYIPRQSQSVPNSPVAGSKMLLFETPSVVTSTSSMDAGDDDTSESTLNKDFPPIQFNNHQRQQSNQFDFEKTQITTCPGNLSVPMLVYHTTAFILRNASAISKANFAKQTHARTLSGGNIVPSSFFSQLPGTPQFARKDSIMNSFKNFGIASGMRMLRSDDVCEVGLILRDMLKDLCLIPTEFHPVFKAILAFNGNSGTKPPDGANIPLPTSATMRLLRDAILLLPWKSRQILNYVLQFLTQLALQICQSTDGDDGNNAPDPTAGKWYYVVSDLAREYATDLFYTPIACSTPTSRAASTPTRQSSISRKTGLLHWTANCLELLIHTQSPSNLALLETTASVQKSPPPFVPTQSAFTFGKINVFGMSPDLKPNSSATVTRKNTKVIDPDELLRNAAELESNYSILWKINTSFMNEVSQQIAVSKASTPIRRSTPLTPRRNMMKLTSPRTMGACSRRLFAPTGKLPAMTMTSEIKIGNDAINSSPNKTNFSATNGRLFLHNQSVDRGQFVKRQRTSYE